MNNQEPKGMQCPNPNCKQHIIISYGDLLSGGSVECPKCRLRLNMKVPEEINEHLQNIADAEAAVHKAKRFRG